MDGQQEGIGNRSSTQRVSGFQHYRNKECRYLRGVLGHRYVPVEIGNSYSESSWGTTVMSVNSFIDKYILRQAPPKKMGYIAQHNLLDQVKELEKDIEIPFYAYCDPHAVRDEQQRDHARERHYPVVNAWLGPAGTVSPLHFDPHDNLLCQVRQPFNRLI